MYKGLGKSKVFAGIVHTRTTAESTLYGTYLDTLLATIE